MYLLRAFCPSKYVKTDIIARNSFKVDNDNIEHIQVRQICDRTLSIKHLITYSKP